MNKNKKTQFRKFVVLPAIFTSAAVPLALAVSCSHEGVGIQGDGGGAIDVLPNAQEAILAKNDIELTEFDFERNVLNTKEYGILPLSRIQHAFEIKETGDNIIPLTESVEDAIVTQITRMRHIDDNDPELQELSKIFIDGSVNGKDGTPQSLVNPFAEIKVKKSEVMEKGYGVIAKQVHDILDADKTAKFSVLTKSLTIDTVGKDGKYNTGEYVMRLYKKKQNSNELNQAISLFTDKSKFDSDEFALNALGGLTLTYVNQMRNDSENESIYSNYIEEDRSNSDTHNLLWNWMYNRDETRAKYKDAIAINNQVPIIFWISDLKDPKSLNPENFVAADGKSGSSSFQFGSKKSLSQGDILFLNTKATEIGNLTLDKKTNQVNLELTITNLNIRYQSHEWDYYSQQVIDEAKSNYEAGSVETIHIPLPLHTSWFKASDQNGELKKFQTNFNKILPTQIHQKLAKLFDNIKNNSPIDDPLNAISLFGPHLKEIVIDLAERVADAEKYTKLLGDGNFLNKFVSWAEKTNPAFSIATLNKVIEENPNGLPTEISLELNSSHVYSLIVGISMLYRQLDLFAETPEGKAEMSMLAK